MEEIHMRNYRGRKTPQNIKNNVRVEPTSVLVISTAPIIKESDTQEFLHYEANFELPNEVNRFRVSSIILPPEVTSVTFLDMTYYQSRKGAWKIKLSKFSSDWSGNGGANITLTLDRDVNEDRLDEILIQFVVACRTQTYVHI
jgi:hypothetical protein